MKKLIFAMMMALAIAPLVVEAQQANPNLRFESTFLPKQQAGQPAYMIVNLVSDRPGVKFTIEAAESLNGPWFPVTFAGDVRQTEAQAGDSKGRYQFMFPRSTLMQRLFLRARVVQ